MKYSKIILTSIVVFLIIYISTLYCYCSSKSYTTSKYLQSNLFNIFESNNLSKNLYEKENEARIYLRALELKRTGDIDGFITLCTDYYHKDTNLQFLWAGLLSIFYFELNNYEKSLSLITHSKQILEDIYIGQKSIPKGLSEKYIEIYYSATLHISGVIKFKLRKLKSAFNDLKIREKLFSLDGFDYYIIASYYYTEKNYLKSKEYYEIAYKLLSGEIKSTTTYNLAALHARNGNINKTIQLLSEAFNFNRKLWLERYAVDDDFNRIRKDLKVIDFIEKQTFLLNKTNRNSIKP